MTGIIKNKMNVNITMNNMKYTFHMTLQLDKFLGEEWRFQSRGFTVEAETKEQATQECKDWAMEYVVELEGKRRKQKDKTLTEEMLAEFEAEIQKAQEGSKQMKEKREHLLKGEEPVTK
jgi:hypothetical protein